MVISPVQLDLSSELTADIDPRHPLPRTVEEFMLCPVDKSEWVNGEIIEKDGMTIKHAQVQALLAWSWRSYALSSHQGGELLVEAPCRTVKQVRRPDVAYASPEFLAELGQVATAPQSFPLVAEVASPTDYAEELFRKAQEYLNSGSEEVWMLFPENQWIMVLTKAHHSWFTAGETVRTQVILPGYAIATDQLLS
jgi:Uma2 family endonuclease